MRRRDFLAATAAAYATTAFVRAADKKPETIRVGLIGCGGFGNSQLNAAFEAGGVEVLALCDVDTAHLDETVKNVTQKQSSTPKTYTDWRELLEHPGLNAIFIATPTHWHALPFIAACEKGYDIYCEKPVAYDLREQRAMIDAAEKAGNVVQIGFQRRESDILAGVRDYLKSGKAGKVIETRANIHFACPRNSRKPQDPPETLDWEFWTGPAPLLPYSPSVGHYSWRWEKTTGNGHLVDWGIHMIDAVRAILGESMPKTVTAGGGIYDMEEFITTPDVMTTLWEFETCPVIWEHRIFGAAEYHPDTWLGVRFYCEKETIFMNDSQWVIIPKAKDAERTVNKGMDYNRLLPAHMGNFLECVRTRRQPSCPITDGVHSTATTQLAMIALETGRKLHWDNEKEMFTNSEAANQHLKRDYRGPWKHPYQR